jgi:hypothetical protein
MVPLEYKIRHCCFKYQKIHNMFLMSAVWNKALCWQYQITQNVMHSYDLQSSLIFHPLYAKQLDFPPQITTSICKAAEIIGFLTVDRSTKFCLKLSEHEWKESQFPCRYFWSSSTFELWRDELWRGCQESCPHTPPGFTIGYRNS